MDTTTDDRTPGNSHEYHPGDEIPADTEAKAKVDGLLEPFARDYYEYCRYRMGVLTDAAWCVGVRVYANLLRVTRDVSTRITYSVGPGYGNTLRVFGLPVWVTSGLGDDEIRLMVPVGTGAKEASRRPASEPMKCGFNVPAPVAEAASEMARRRYLQLSEETWGRVRETYGGRDPAEPESPSADEIDESGGIVIPEDVAATMVSPLPPPKTESWHDRPPYL